MQYCNINVVFFIIGVKDLRYLHYQKHQKPFNRWQLTKAVNILSFTRNTKR